MNPYLFSQIPESADQPESCGNVQWFRGGLVFKAHRLLHHSTLGLRLIKMKRRITRESRNQPASFGNAGNMNPYLFSRIPDSAGIREYSKTPLSSEYGTHTTVNFSRPPYLGVPIFQDPHIWGSRDQFCTSKFSSDFSSDFFVVTFFVVTSECLFSDF